MYALYYSLQGIEFLFYVPFLLLKKNVRLQCYAANSIECVWFFRYDRIALCSQSYKAPGIYKGSECPVSISENLRRGSVDLIILTLLKHEDMYGYQLVQEMEHLSKGDYTLTESTLYPVLYRLEDRGLISSRRELIGKRRVRVYYHIEPTGIAYLEAIREEYLVTMRGIMSILHADEKGDH